MTKMLQNAKFLVILLVFGGLIYTGCADTTSSPEPEPEQPVMSGSLDMSRVATLGNSLTAGYVSGGWTTESLATSPMNLIVNSAYGGNNVGPQASNRFIFAAIPGDGNPRPAIQLGPPIQAGVYADGTPVLFPNVQAPGQVDPTMLNPMNATVNRSFNNLAHPGALALDLLTKESLTNSIGVLNPLYQLSLRNLGTQVEQAKSLDPTVVFIWTGNNEWLGSALAGGMNPPYPPVDEVTPPGMMSFQSIMTEMVSELAAPDRQIVLFETVDLSVVPSVSGVGVPVGDNRAFITDLSGDGVWADTLAFWKMNADGGTPGVRVGADEYVMFSWLLRFLEAQDNYGLTPLNPLEDEHVITREQIAVLQGAADAYNNILRGIAASSPNIHTINTSEVFAELAANGVTVGGTTYTTDLFGGLFSFDNVHPSPLGNAAAANLFMDRINAQLGANLQHVDLSMFAPPSPRMAPIEGPVNVDALRSTHENAVNLFTGSRD